MNRILNLVVKHRREASSPTRCGENVAGFDQGAETEGQPGHDRLFQECRHHHGQVRGEERIADSYVWQSPQDGELALQSAVAICALFVSLPTAVGVAAGSAIIASGVSAFVASAIAAAIAVACRALRPAMMKGGHDGDVLAAFRAFDPEVLCYAFCADPELTSRSLELFLGNATLGVLAFRIVDPGTGETPRRYVPRLRAGSPARSSEVTHFLGGACAIRRSTFESVGGYPDMFFYAHEEIDLAWKALDKGFHLAYRGDLRIAHPTTRPSRHPDYYFFTTRNRVFVARRRLPLVIAFSYVLTWSAITLVRARRPRDIRQILRGLAAGVRAPCGGRRPMSWATIWRMARLGRPPII